MPVDAFPDVTPVQVNIYTETPGLAAEDVETLLTVPIETAMAGLPGVEQIRSVSLFGLSYVAVYFKDDVDIYFARRLVEREAAGGEGAPARGLWRARAWPQHYGPRPGVLVHARSAAGRASARWICARCRTGRCGCLLRTAPGVDDVTSWGGFEKQFQVLVDPRRLAAFGLTFRDLIEALAANNKQVGGQYIDAVASSTWCAAWARGRSAADIGSVVIADATATPVYVRDVAEVKEGPGCALRRRHQDGQEVVLGIALQRIGENAANVVDGGQEQTRNGAGGAAQGGELKPVYDRTELVDKARRHRRTRAGRRLGAGGDGPVPVPGRFALGAGGHRGAAACRC